MLDGTMMKVDSRSSDIRGNGGGRDYNSERGGEGGGDSHGSGRNGGGGASHDNGHGNENGRGNLIVEEFIETTVCHVDGSGNFVTTMCVLPFSGASFGERRHCCGSELIHP